MTSQRVTTHSGLRPVSSVRNMKSASSHITIVFSIRAFHLLTGLSGFAVHWTAKSSAPGSIQHLPYNCVILIAHISADLWIPLWVVTTLLRHWFTIVVFWWKASILVQHFRWIENACFVLEKWWASYQIIFICGGWFQILSRKPRDLICRRSINSVPSHCCPATFQNSASWGFTMGSVILGTR